MTLARILCLSLALAAAACATPGRALEPTVPAAQPTYHLCSDPQFSCTPASTTPEAASPIQVDTNLAAPHRSPAFG